MNLIVLIPVYNEASHLRPVVEAVVKKGLKVLVVDDGSNDGSGAMARDAGAEVLCNPERRGKGFSLKRGFEHALRTGCTGVITMDGDGQHGVEDLDPLLEMIEQSPVCVIVGNRMGDPEGMPGIRLATNRLMSWMISGLCRQTIPDTQCGYRYISSDILRRLKIMSDDFEIETEVLVQASRLGYAVSSVPIHTIYRDEKSKINPFKDTLRFLRYYLGECFRRS